MGVEIRTMKERFKAWIFGLALGAMLGTMPAGAAEKLRVSIIPINDVTPLFSAIKQGYFAEEGLEIDTAPSAGGAVGIPGLVAGSYDIVYGNVVSMLLAAFGAACSLLFDRIERLAIPWHGR